MARHWQSEVLFAQAQRMFRRSRPDEAIILYRRALEANPKSAGVLLHLAIALAEQGEYREAVNAVNRAIGLNIKNPVFYSFLGLIHYDEGVYDAATQAYEKAAGLDPNYRYPRYLKGLIDFSLGRFDEADACFQQQYHWGLDFQSRLLLASELYLMRHGGEAASFFQSELTVTAPATQTRGWRKAIRRFRVNLQFGFPALFRRLLHSPTDGDLNWIDLKARKYNALGDFNAAIGEFRNLLGHPDSRLYQKALLQLAEISLGIGDFEGCLNYCRLIPEYRHIIDSLEHSSTRPESAAANPVPDPELLTALGIAFFESGETDKARRALLAASRADPKDYLCYYYLGLCELALVLRDRPAGPHPVRELRPALNWFKKALDEVHPGLVAKRVAATLRVAANTD